MTFGPEHMDLFNGFNLEAGVNLDRFTSFRVGGPADLLARPETVEELVRLAGIASHNHIPVTILGGGSNTLISDRGIQGLVLVLSRMKAAPKAVDTDAGIRVTALAGERLSTLCRMAVEKGWRGLEWAAGIPGTLGGALMMNAGSHGGDMSEITVSMDILDMETLEYRTLKAGDLDFSYRSLNLGGAVILKAELTLAPGNAGEVRQRFEANLKAKKKSQPVSKASGGCFFKNPSPDNPAGRLIEQAGLKGYRMHGAMVSDLHANFIINHDNASCSDILALKRLVQDRVYEKFGIRLETEVKAIGR
ncbi:MAG: UDP-N-acetylmuramate dehydrogenase [Desulfobacter sp.]|nr:MAG: UDP-N-acetylmuramate dehydrogenase [Desulfobacter sp.]